MVRQSSKGRFDSGQLCQFQPWNHPEAREYNVNSKFQHIPTLSQVLDVNFTCQQLEYVV